MKKLILLIGILALSLNLYASSCLPEDDLVLANLDSPIECEKENTTSDVLIRQKRGIACDCGGNMVCKTTYTDWVHVATKQCPDRYVNKIHEIYQRIRTETWRCGNCGLGHITSRTEKDERCIRYK